MQKDLIGSWEVSCSAVSIACEGRSASGRCVADDTRAREVGLCHSSREAEASAGAVAAESVDLSAGAPGGNTYQQSTHWALSQARVTKALERIRQLLPSHTRGGSRVRESREHGSGRGRAMKRTSLGIQRVGFAAITHSRLCS